MIICLFPTIAGQLTVARRLSPWSSIAISVLLQHHWDKQAPMFAATGETEASSPAGDGRNAARGGGAHAPSTARVPGARRSFSVRRGQFGDLIRASLNGGLVASTRQLASDVLGCIVLPLPACMRPPHAVGVAAGPDARNKYTHSS